MPPSLAVPAVVSCDSEATQSAPTSRLQEEDRRNRIPGGGDPVLRALALCVTWMFDGGCRHRDLAFVDHPRPEQSPPSRQHLAMAEPATISPFEQRRLLESPWRRRLLSPSRLPFDLTMAADEIVTSRRNEHCDGARAIAIRVLVATAVVHNPSVSSASGEIVVVGGGLKI